MVGKHCTKLRKLFLLIGIIVSSLPGVYADIDNFTVMPHMLAYNFGWAGMILMVLLWLLFWSVVIYVLFILVDKIIKELRPQSSIEILRRRYAKGDITKREFEEMRKELRK